MFMTDLWYIKCNDFLRFETLKCPEIFLKFAKNLLLKFHYFLLGPLRFLSSELTHNSSAAGALEQTRRLF